MKWQLIDLICISLVNNDAYWPFVYLCSIYSGALPILKNQLFAFLLLQYRSSLYFVDINPLWDRRFADVFSCITGCLFILLILSLGAQNFLILTLSSLCTFSFVAYAFSVLSKKILLNPMLWSFSLTFSSKSF